MSSRVRSCSSPVIAVHTDQVPEIEVAAGRLDDPAHQQRAGYVNGLAVAGAVVSQLMAAPHPMGGRHSDPELIADTFCGHGMLRLSDVPLLSATEIAVPVAIRG